VGTRRAVSVKDKLGNRTGLRKKKVRQIADAEKLENARENFHNGKTKKLLTCESESDKEKTGGPRRKKEGI